MSRFGVRAKIGDCGLSRAIRKAVEPEEVHAQIAFECNVCATSRAATAIASAEVGFEVRHAER